MDSDKQQWIYIRFFQNIFSEIHLVRMQIYHHCFVSYRWKTTEWSGEFAEHVILQAEVRTFQNISYLTPKVIMVLLLSVHQLYFYQKDLEKIWYGCRHCCSSEFENKKDIFRLTMITFFFNVSPKQFTPTNDHPKPHLRTI